MDGKVCFKCGELKPIEEYYVHKRMGDGHLGKCKCCTKKDTKDRVARKMQDPIWVAMEATRHREKSKRARDCGRASKTSLKARKKWEAANKEKKLAHGKVANAIRSGKLARSPCEVCGEVKVQAHHDDYSKPLEVRWLCTKHHGKSHIKPWHIVENVLKEMKP